MQTKHCQARQPDALNLNLNPNLNFGVVFILIVLTVDKAVCYTPRSAPSGTGIIAFYLQYLRLYAVARRSSADGD